MRELAFLKLGTLLGCFKLTSFLELASRLSDVALGFKLETSKILSKEACEIEGGDSIQSEIVGAGKLSCLSRSRSKLMTSKSPSDLSQFPP